MGENTEQEKANIGADIETFCRSNVGRYLIECAQKDELSALRKLADANPADHDTLYKLQLDAKAPRKVMEWIKKAISAGKAARYISDQEVEAW